VLRASRASVLVKAISSAELDPWVKSRDQTNRLHLSLSSGPPTVGVLWRLVGRLFPFLFPSCRLHMDPSTMAHQHWGVTVCCPSLASRGRTHGWQFANPERNVGGHRCSAPSS